jgi:hypothetical protein
MRKDLAGDEEEGQTMSCFEAAESVWGCVVVLKVLLETATQSLYPLFDSVHERHTRTIMCSRVVSQVKSHKRSTSVKDKTNVPIIVILDCRHLVCGAARVSNVD